MRCKKHHPSDLSSSVGVCSSCLRERLLALIAAQEKAHLAQVVSRASVASDDYPKKSDRNPPPLIFPRSVSPYVSRRKSDYASWQSYDPRHSLFYSTPQVGPPYGTGNTAADSEFTGRTASSKKKGKFWIFSNLFRSRSDKFESNPRISSQVSCEPSSSASPSWFSTFFAGRRKNLNRMGSLEDSTVRGRRHYPQRDRGMSPVTTENFVEDCDGYDRSPSASGYSTESSPRWRKTPAVAPYLTRRSRHGRNVSGMTFCLSPLVRASPNPHWNPKGLPPELTGSGEIRATAKPHISIAASYCANRSRKLADFGRGYQNH